MPGTGRAPRGSMLRQVPGSRRKYRLSYLTAYPVFVAIPPCSTRGASIQWSPRTRVLSSAYAGFGRSGPNHIGARYTMA